MHFALVFESIYNIIRLTNCVQNLILLLLKKRNDWQISNKSFEFFLKNYVSVDVKNNAFVIIVVKNSKHTNDYSVIHCFYIPFILIYTNICI